MKKQKGITLVALVISIIILLILAGISISALTNQGLFGRANEAKRESEIANIKEQIALDIYEKQLEPPLGSITDEQLETTLGKYGTVNKEDGKIVGITTAKGYEILLKDIYGGETVAESVPDGATVTPVNDITTWLKTGEISKQYSYTTIEQVIADSTCTESLMSNENAMKYLARSTEFANAICASETTMTHLGQSAYVDDTVLNSDSWVTAIPMSPYWNKVSAITVTIYGGASETITITGLYGSPTVTTNSDGSVNYSLPVGMFKFTGSVSGESFSRTVKKDTTIVYAKPENSLYWYGINSNVSNIHYYTKVPDKTYYNSIAGKISGLIDLTKFNKIRWKTSNKNTVYNFIAVSPTNDSNFYFNKIASIEQSATSGELDITELSGSYYVFAGAYQGASNDCMSVTDYSSYFKCYNSTKDITAYFDGVWLE